jgi:hypothetical protein
VNLKEKIICCYGNLKVKSIPKVTGASYGYTKNVIMDYCKLK